MLDAARLLSPELLLGLLLGALLTLLVLRTGGKEQGQGQGETTDKSTRAYDLSAPPDSVPAHVAVIMDGNRRYGLRVHGDPMKGHWDGGKLLTEFVQWCAEDGVQVLTVYAFSSENWARSAAEVDTLMRVFAKYADSFASEAASRNVRVNVLCTDEARLPATVRASVAALTAATSQCSGFTFNICLSYGGREDIVRACDGVARELRGQAGDVRVTAQMLSDRLSTAGTADPDLLIRTSGERRLSNFLLWQLAYTELVFVDKTWPELRRSDLRQALHEYADRQRRFGR